MEVSKIKDKLRKKYGSILSDINESQNIINKVKPITLGSVLGDNLSKFYDTYLSDLNIIIMNFIEKQERTIEVSFDTYNKFATLFIESTLLDEEDRNSEVIMNFLNALSIVRNSNDIKDNIQAMVLIMYETYYIKSI